MKTFTELFHACRMVGLSWPCAVRVAGWTVLKQWRRK